MRLNFFKGCPLCHWVKGSSFKLHGAELTTPPLFSPDPHPILKHSLSLPVLSVYTVLSVLYVNNWKTMHKLNFCVRLSSEIIGSYFCVYMGSTYNLPSWVLGSNCKQKQELFSCVPVRAAQSHEEHVRFRPPCPMGTRKQSRCFSIAIPGKGGFYSLKPPDSVF